MIYLDHNASTSIDPQVREAMLPFLGSHFGNPSSSHAPGQMLRAAVEEARANVARLLGASVEEIVFTSGGTEANNHAIKGVALSRKRQGNHLILSQIEHPSVLNPCLWLQTQGFELSLVPVDSQGLVDPDAVVQEVRPTTILISIMHANNEVGTIQPIREIAQIAREGGILMHTDAAQSAGKIPVDVNELEADLISFAGHKLYAPQGIGALFVRQGVHLDSLLHGAGHERGRRAGTEPVAQIVGLGKAAALARDHLNNPEMIELRDHLYRTLHGAFGDEVELIGHPAQRLPNTAAIGFRGRIGAEILEKCPELCASTGAACHAGERTRSRVLEAMNVPEEIAFGMIRFSLGQRTTREEINETVDMIVRAVRDLPRG